MVWQVARLKELLSQAEQEKGNTQEEMSVVRAQKEQAERELVAVQGQMHLELREAISKGRDSPANQREPRFASPGRFGSLQEKLQVKEKEAAWLGQEVSRQAELIEKMRGDKDREVEELQMAKEREATALNEEKGQAMRALEFLTGRKEAASPSPEPGEARKPREEMEKEIAALTEQVVLKEKERKRLAVDLEMKVRELEAVTQQMETEVQALQAAKEAQAREIAALQEQQGDAAASGVCPADPLDAMFEKQWTDASTAAHKLHTRVHVPESPEACALAHSSPT